MHAFPIYDWVVSIFVGSVVVSYWRCTWVLMDLWLCDQPEDASLAQGNSFCLLVDATLDPEVAALRVQSACISYGIGVGCLAVGVTIIWMGWWVPQNDKQRVTPLVAIVRFVAIYFLGFSGVNIWRGIWYLADDWILPTQPYASYWTTSIAGSSLCFLLWGGNSLLAPPSIFLLDGPGLASPPVAVTLLSSHFAVSLPVDQEPPQLSLPTMMADVMISFLLLPFGVVWYWRGSWLLLGEYNKNTGRYPMQTRLARLVANPSRSSHERRLLVLGLDGQR
jgi:Fuseless